MAKSLISNPPYNLKWEQPALASFQKRFQGFTIPPTNNANFVFVLTALEAVTDKAVFILPNGVLTSDTDEKKIRQELVENNWLEAVITLPDRMFESTSIPTCILVFNKKKETLNVAMIDLRNQGTEEVRLQNGQFGGKAHEGRTYKKTVNTLSEETRNSVLTYIKEQKNVDGICQIVTPAEMQQQEYVYQPSRYIGIGNEVRHRKYEDIVADYNRIMQEKNAVKITMNKTAGKSLGFFDAFNINQLDLTETFAVIGAKPVKDNYITFSANDGIKIEVSTKGKALPHIVTMFLSLWQAQIMNLNDEENRILAELRDALVNDFMTGKIKA